MKPVFVCSMVTGMASWLCGWEGLLACAVILLVLFWASVALDRMEEDTIKWGGDE